jgi:hypothetical protein
MEEARSLQTYDGRYRMDIILDKQSVASAVYFDLAGLADHGAVLE